MLYYAKDKVLDLSTTQVMGIVNVTPDSFSDGGKYFSSDKAIKKALSLIDEGADLLDFGAESTRPGAGAIAAEEQLNRLLPVLEEVVSRVDVPISIDTMSATVAKSCLEVGAHIINDVSGFKSDPKLAGVVAEANAGCVLMHMRGTPQTMQGQAAYNDLFKEVYSELEESIQIALNASVPKTSILVDPGFGFAKDAEQTLGLLKNLNYLTELGYPVLIGSSRKSFIRKALDQEGVEALRWGTAATCAYAVMQGASVVRVHDVNEIKMFMTMLDKIRSSHVGSLQVEHDQAQKRC